MCATSRAGLRCTSHTATAPEAWPTASHIASPGAATWENASAVAASASLRGSPTTSSGGGAAAGAAGLWA